MQLFEDPLQDGIELYDETYHFHASQIHSKKKSQKRSNIPDFDQLDSDFDSLL